jgi:hypothetical protein
MLSSSGTAARMWLCCGPGRQEYRMAVPSMSLPRGLVMAVPVGPRVRPAHPG